MLIRIAKSWQLKDNDITSESVYNERRNILKKMGILAATAPIAGTANAGIFDVFKSKEPEPVIDPRKPLKSVPSKYTNHTLTLTPEEKILTYNNFYEFGTAKHQPAENAKGFKTDPWQVEIGGEVHEPYTIDFADILNQFAVEDRYYRFRCVEAWSMNVPWLGFPISKLIEKAKPKGNAKFVAFQTLYDPERMPGQKSRSIGGGIDYPYVEGLTIQEAMHPLAIMSVGLYGKTLAPQNGAPLRLMVPWKYGFKSIKSIVKIVLTEHQPPTTWSQLAPHEYGFYANVNPHVDHPRWSQASERFIGEGKIFSSTRQDTLMFNGYEDEVANLYTGLDLNRNY
ncbi:putative sulfite oxidase subunit YedY [Vibrio nigripulchritudo SO65]|uniref:protein-methionine-sulfoxide reductase catalytic subunit MsrP n=1 Tax=Vibrio nigripulchritudo TaxID=28173 RepID=UPI0003B1C4D6|nr:protein-methionine-sulfoxide reductase catalytic subunit MsrP [Vibrio nigripulchritudo]CCN33123.1 putative sulfite oxidase subunit YedY [Vibrio nigripulchritudo AM115]CCN40803.1 putative sulfite oxidase subunit YedY [Vibrio nigripulchritudo FTn2]CCN67213.1 putative sulfite oxidase subunit YedY [Vibrio nigripulchritudo POn4]CCN78711.1 putative sulfite oxidase subunit YedY [Vibrio nigripulchritudo SO65]